MKKKLFSLLLAAVMVFSLVACGESASEDGSASSTPGSSTVVEENTASSAAAPEASSDVGAESSEANAEDGETVTVVDHLGNEVTVKKNPQRVVICDIYPLPSMIAIFCDSADKIVGMPAPAMSAAQNSLLGQLYPEILEAETGYIDGSDLNMEEVAKLEPDVVFYSSAQPQQGEQLTAAGYAAVAVSPSNWGFDAIETLKNWVGLLGEIFPENDKSQICDEYSDEVYNLIQERVADLSDEEKERVFFLFQYSEDTLLTSGAKFWGQWWASAIGAVNVAGEVTDPGSISVDMEQIYAWNPDMIFVTNFTTAQPDDLYNNTIGSYDWSGVAAIQNQKVYKMPLGMYRSFTTGIDTPITLLWLAKSTYPDLFEDIDITEKTKEYYSEVFGIDLTDEQANSIFAPVSEAASGLA